MEAIRPNAVKELTARRRARAALEWYRRNRELARGVIGMTIGGGLGYEIGSNSTGDLQGLSGQLFGLGLGALCGFAFGVAGIEGISAAMSGSPSSPANVEYIRKNNMPSSEGSSSSGDIRERRLARIERRRKRQGEKADRYWARRARITDRIQRRINNRADKRDAKLRRK